MRAVVGRPSARAVLVAAGVAALAVLAAILRLRALSAPYWIDEGISVGVAGHPLSAIPGVLRQDGSPPLYYLLLHVWMALFGSAPSSTHALSAGLAIACVPAAWWAVAPFGAWAGLIAAGLMAFDPYIGLYADETRMYSLLLLLGVLVCGTFLRAFVLRRRVHVATFGLMLALALYAHAWGAFLVLAAGLAWVALVIAGPHRRALVRDGVLAFGGAALLFAPWVPTLLYQAAHTGAPWSHRPTGRSLERAVTRIWSGQRAELLLLPAAAVGLALGALRSGRSRRGLLAMVVIAAMTLLGAFAYSHFGTPAWALRYLVVVLAPLALLVALGLGRLALLGPLAVLATALFAWHGRPTVATLEHKSNVAQVARALAPALPAGTLVFSTQPEQVPELAHELPPGMHYATPLGRVVDPGVMDWRDALARLSAARFAATLGPELRGLRHGARFLLVQPMFSHPDSPWTLKIRDIARHWGHAVRLRRLRTVHPTHGNSRSTVAAVLMERL
jgi:mannosyltransferase